MAKSEEVSLVATEEGRNALPQQESAAATAVTAMGRPGKGKERERLRVRSFRGGARFVSARLPIRHRL